jgi:very-short-patch-repair endonuclease
LFPNNTNKQISKILNRTESQIRNKSNRLSLKKTTAHKSKLRSITNKSNGRDLSYEKLKKIALKYKTRSEFLTLDSSAYQTCRKNNLLDIFCSHMIKANYSTPQLILYYILSQLFNLDKLMYNTRKIIKPYELDIYIPKYKLAFEYDGKGWHQNNENDIIKNGLCDINNIKLIRLKENNRNYIGDVKCQLISNLDIINKISEKNISSQDINNITEIDINNYVNSQILDDDKIKKIISMYDNYSEFRTNEMILYVKLVKNKTLDKFTSHLPRRIISWELDDVKIEINKYEYLLDFIEKSTRCYSYIKRNKLENLLINLKRRNRELLNDELVINEINKYENLSDFREKSPKYYAYVVRHKKFTLIEKLKRHKNWVNRKR